jgi:transcriptional regulator with XRE-family HTH domain
MGSLEHDRALLAGLAEFYGMTANAIARRANVAATTINRPFNGSATTRLSQPTIDKLKRAFPAYPGWSEFFGAATDSADAEEEQLLALWHQLDATSRSAILHLVRTIATGAASPRLNDPGPGFRP